MTNRTETPKRSRHTSRASFACYRCKKAKRRCDISQEVGSTGSCSTCRIRNETCDFREYGDDKRKQRLGSKALEARVAVLERELQILSSHQKPNYTEDQVDDSDEVSWQMRYSHSRPDSDGGSKHVACSDEAKLPPHSSPRGLTSPFSTTSVHQAAPVIGGCVDASATSGSSVGSRKYSNDSKEPRRFPIGMDEVTPLSGALEDDENGNEHYFGASSMFPYGDTQSSSPHHLARREDLTPSFLHDIIDPEPIVSHLLDLFWTYQASHLLIVDRDIFLHHRQLAQSSDGIGDRNYYTPCLLYSMLALASLISTDRGVKRYSTAGGIPGDLFNQRARTLFNMEMECPTVTTAQAAILIGSRYGTFVDSSLGWTFCGIALRVVAKLCLHLDCSRMVESKRRG
ncbi:hypothetical protein BO71DRAFT_164043 [Aspergillus ellipticus CBS 707.79]|uniref:Zn(2)-C6 fungal-type domain-containing protein n=1 Tax=Aspergillus ellipticus CBS 707.79 TaxID=1448320 RepID=A0A319DZ50_9EURO|nr:hypothetical protein BO71DRAFT_164043 [Aspergillus ellipticus CBS 707.79]